MFDLVLEIFWSLLSQHILYTSVSIMALRMKDLNFCLPTNIDKKLSCGFCPCVFDTKEQKTVHNLQHFVPCTMCRRIVRSRDQLVNHLKVDHQRSELTRVKVHNVDCKTYNLPTIPKPAESFGPSRLDSSALPIFRRCWKAEILEMTSEVLHCQCLSGLLLSCQALSLWTLPWLSLAPFSQGVFHSRQNIHW